MNAHDLNQKLLERIEEVCQYLLPDGKKKKSEWICGSADGESGQSFGVRLTGEKKGFWNDFASSDSGKSLVTLWRRSKGIPPDEWKRSHDEIREWLGIKEYEPRGLERARPKPFRKPNRNLLRNFNIHQFINFSDVISE